MFCKKSEEFRQQIVHFRVSLGIQNNSPEEDVSINAVVKDETIWLSQKAMAELFDCSPDNISLHLKNIYSDGELSETATAEDFSVVTRGKTVMLLAISVFRVSPALLLKNAK